MSTPFVHFPQEPTSKFRGSISKFRGSVWSAEGIAPFVVFSHGLDRELVAGKRGQPRPVEMLCPMPEASNTRGEAQMLGELAGEPGWRTVVAVAGDYHHARARTLLSRCIGDSVEITFVTVNGDAVAMRVYLHEVAGLGLAYTFSRAC